MQSLQIFFGTAERQQNSQLFICQEAGEHYTDSREKLPYLLGGRRCSEKEACEHGVLFSLLSLAPVSVYSKKTTEQKFHFHLSKHGTTHLRAGPQK